MRQQAEPDGIKVILINTDDRKAAEITLSPYVVFPILYRLMYSTIFPLIELTLIFSNNFINAGFFERINKFRE